MQWDALEQKQAGLHDPDAQGRAAYAAKQADTRRRLATRFATLWSADPTVGPRSGTVPEDLRDGAGSFSEQDVAVFLTNGVADEESEDEEDSDADD